MAEDNTTAPQTADCARQYIERYGVALVKLPPGKKYPTHDAWEQPDGYFTDAAEAAEFFAQNPKWGMGAVLGPSKLCSLDIDKLDDARIIFSEFGIDVDAWADAYPSIVGNPERFRVMFRAPADVELSKRVLSWPDRDDPKRSHVVFELRAGLVQDVLPPTIHPDTGAPYSWRRKPGAGFPELPAELLVIWQQWDVFKANARALCPWAVDAPKPPPTPPRYRNPAEPSVIELYCEAHDIRDALERHGYKRQGKRYLSPHTTTGVAGVVIIDGNRCLNHHGSDPLCSDETGRPINPFDLFCHREHRGDLPAATRAAARLLGIAHKTRAEKQADRQAAQMRAAEAAGERVDPETGELIDGRTAAPVQHGDTATPPAEPRRAPADDAPFTALGYDRGTYFYLAAGTQQITQLSASAHTKANLVQLAPLDYWEREFPGRQGANWDAAMDALMRQCEARGVFSPSILRGRGAWHDDGRIVVHLGDRVLVDGVAVKPGRVASRFVYEARLPMAADLSNPLTAAEARRYVELMQMMSWEKPMHATLAAGWCVVAHVGGVLPWRPHIWVVGGRGAGKTHVMSKVIRPVLGDNVATAQGDTTEAGLRQTLGSDALPVLFDEAEGPDTRANDRIQNVLSLARQSSSETGGKILKGTTGGRSMEFTVRSCFAFSSINANLVQQADRSRVTVLELNQANRKHALSELEAAEHALLTDEYIRRFYARSLTMAETIRRNASAFAAAAAIVLGEQRAGDQISALLAGAYSLTSNREVSLQEAEGWVRAQDWTEQREEVQSQSDETALLQRLLEQHIRLNTSLGVREYTLGELIKAATEAGSQGTEISRPEAIKAVERYGFRPTDDGRGVIVSNTHAEIRRMLDGTPWAVNWGRVLKRLPGATAAAGAVYFAGTVSRATQVPLSAIGGC